MNREKILKEIATYSELTSDWDGDGAEAITTECIDAATSFVSYLNMDYADISVAASPDGEIVVYWRDAGKVYIEVNFNYNGECDIQHVGPDAKEKPELYKVFKIILVCGLIAAFVIMTMSI